MIHFAFVGRLEKEKGFDRILKSYEIFCSRYPLLKDSLHISIFGEGSLFEDRNIDNIESTLLLPGLYFYGKRGRNIIDSIFREYVHYSLIPSVFLETFGLVALESLQNGVPVLGYRKGGLVDFITEENTLDENLGSEGIVMRMYQIIQNNTIPNKRDVIDAYKQYSNEIWNRNLISLVGKAQRILIVNDYKTFVGGAEAYVSFLQKNLEISGRSVDILGYSHPFISSWKRKLLFLQATCNIESFLTLRKYILSSSPEIIWCHSILRYHGILGLLAIYIYGGNSKKMITYHDFGLVAPFPSKIESIDQIPLYRSIRLWIQSSNRFLSLKLCLGLLIKYIYTSFLAFFIKRFDVHIVPSRFMVGVIAQNIGKEEKDITLFPHCAIRE